MVAKVFFCKTRRIFICYIIKSCRHSATTEAYGNGTRKGNGGNKISPWSFDTTLLAVCIVIGVLLVILPGLTWIFFYNKRKKWRGNLLQ